MIEEYQQISKEVNIQSLICQLDCETYKIKENISRVQKSLEKYSDNDKLDFVLFPEMAFSGYTFKSLNDIKPCLEKCGQGPIFEFCQKLAIKLKCYVACGYAEIYVDKDYSQEHYYNSAYLIDRNGNLILNHRKKHLFQTDQTWAEEGPSFNQIILKNTENIEFTATLAICMDLEPWEYQDKTQFELADFCFQQKIDVILFLTAWDDAQPLNTSQQGMDKIVNYWIHRLNTVVNSQGKKENELYKNLLFLCSDRVGVDISLDTQKLEQVDYSGCSCAILLNPLKKLFVLPKKEQGFVISQAKVII